MPKDQLQSFSSNYAGLQGRELLLSTNLRETSCCATQLFVTSPGVATRTELSQLRQNLLFKERQCLVGCCLILNCIWGERQTYRSTTMQKYLLIYFLLAAGGVEFTSHKSQAQVSWKSVSLQILNPPLWSGKTFLNQQKILNLSLIGKQFLHMRRKNRPHRRWFGRYLILKFREQSQHHNQYLALGLSPLKPEKSRGPI